MNVALGLVMFVIAVVGFGSGHYFFALCASFASGWNFASSYAIYLYEKRR